MSLPKVNKNLGSSFETTNGFVKDTSVQPYMRPQSLSVSGKGMAVNSPVKPTIDGLNVTPHLINPDIIELTNVKGSFEKDDVIGYVDTNTNKFKPLASVVGVLNTSSNVKSNTTTTRLSVVGNFHTQYPDCVFPSSANVKLVNATIDGNGTYTTTNTAFGTVNLVSQIADTANGVYSNTFITQHLSGTIISVGDATVSAPKVYKSTHPGDSEFLSTYGVWSDPNGVSDLDITHTCVFPTTQNYYFQIDPGTINDARFYIDGVEIGRNAGIVATSVNAGAHSIRFKGTHQTNYMSKLAIAVADSPWDANGSVKNGGTILFASNQHPTSNVPANVSGLIVQTGGTTTYLKTRRISLQPVANTADDHYTGSTIHITTSRIVPPDPTDPKSILDILTNVHTANIISYEGKTRTATLDVDVDITVGFHKHFGELTSTYTIHGTEANFAKSRATTGRPHKPSTNEAGEVHCILNIPHRTIPTGQKNIRFDDRDSDDKAPETANTWAEGTFHSHALSHKRDEHEHSAGHTSARRRFIRQEDKDDKLVNTHNQNDLDPVAQTFTIDAAQYPNGVFLKNIQLFFSKKPKTSNSTITLSVVGTLNGAPSGETLDHSTVTLTADKVNTSNTPHYLDSTTYTQFDFRTPVYIQPNTLYAFLLETSSKDYVLYDAIQLSNAIPSTARNLPTDPLPTSITKIGNVPYVGPLFESQNAHDWKPDASKSLMFVMNRAVFDTANTHVVTFRTRPKAHTRPNVLHRVHEHYSSNIIPNHHNTIHHHTIVSHAHNISTSHLTPSKTKISYTHKAKRHTGDYDDEKPIVPGTHASPHENDHDFDDGYGPRIIDANVANSVIVTATLETTDNAVTPMVDPQGVTVYSIEYLINNLELANNLITVTNSGSGYNAACTYVSVSSPDLPGGTQAYATVTVANTKVTGITFTNTGSGYLQTPTFTIADANVGAPGTGAIVTTTSEYSPSGGNAMAKYITQKATLAAGNDSGDLRVFMTAYRPTGTNIHVFYKVLNRADTQRFEDGSWQLMTSINSTDAFSVSKDDLIEIEKAPGINNIANNQLSYTSTTGITYNSFYQFAIKVVFTTTDNTVIPYLTNLRVLALPSGTGL